MQFSFLNLLFISFVSYVLTITLNEKEMILDTYYGDKIKAITLYNDLQKKITEEKYNPCHKWDTIDHVDGIIRENLIQLEVKSKIIGSEDGFFVDIEENLTIESPALLECNVEHNGKFFHNHKCLIMNEKNHPFILIEDGEREGKPAFVLEILVFNRDLIRNYKENFWSTKEWFESRAGVRKINTDKCISLFEILPREEVTKGDIRIGNRTLYLDEELTVTLPGILKCYIFNHYGSPGSGHLETKYVIPRDPSGDYWFEVFPMKNKKKLTLNSTLLKILYL